MNAHLAVAIDEVMALRQLVHAFEEGLADCRVLEGHVWLQRLGVELFDEVRVLQEAFDLRGIHERAVHLGIVEGLDAEVVAGAEQFAPVLVPDYEGEHAPDALQQIDAPLLIAMEQHLGVAFGGEGVARGDQFVAQRLVIVDFAVEGDDQRTVLIVDRLLASAQIDDAQATMSQSHMLVDVVTLTVRTTVSDDIGHPLQGRAFDIDWHIVDESGDSTHNCIIPSKTLDNRLPKRMCVSCVALLRPSRRARAFP